ncbi:MAG: hypothetical protein IJP62_08165 [Treponema sp.]|nr:hypothetical protein [Treponema sp.]
MKKLLSVFAVSFLNRRKEKSMEYSTTAINSSKVRIEPVFVTAEFSGGQIEEKVGPITTYIFMPTTAPMTGKLLRNFLFCPAQSAPSIFTYPQPYASLPKKSPPLS